MRWIKRLGLCFLILLLLVIGVVFICDWIINESADGLVYENIDEIPENHVGLVLGTSPKLRGGKANRYFDYRIEAAVSLYRHGKIRRILVSGDNRRRNYNEPIEMRKALLAQGVPDSVIVLDYAGIRTFDSVVRAKKVFGQNRITIISQRFHNERALYIAKLNDVDAVGFNARDVDAYSGLKTNTRELLARVKVFIDLLIGTSPRHLGEPILIF